jgi:hypothetical protein
MGRTWWVWAGLLLAGCYKHTFVMGPQGMSGPPDYQRWHSGLLWGIVELDETNLRQVCDGRDVSADYDHQDVLNWLVTALTGGIYQASTVRVWCASDASALALPPEGTAPAGELDLVVSEDGTAWLAADGLPAQARPVARRGPDGQWASP